MPEKALTIDLSQRFKKQLLLTNNGKSVEPLDYKPSYLEAEPPRSFKVD